MGKITTGETVSVNDLIEVLFAVRDSGLRTETGNAAVYFEVNGQKFRLTEVVYIDRPEDIADYGTAGPLVLISGPDN